MDETELGALPIFDKVATFDRLDGDVELFAELIQMFKADSSQQLAQLASMLSAGQAMDAYKMAHAIKGSLGNIGAMRAHRVALEIEREGKAGRCDTALLERLKAEISAYLVAVEK